MHKKNTNDINNIVINELSSRDEYFGEKGDKDINEIMEEQINDTLKILYLELAIYYCYDLFVRYCEKVVEKIIYNLGRYPKNW